MAWTDAVQGAARSSGWSLSKHWNAAKRRPGQLPGGFAPDRRWTALCSLRICMAIRRVARLASPDSGANVCPPIDEMSSINFNKPPISWEC